MRTKVLVTVIVVLILLPLGMLFAGGQGEKEAEKAEKAEEKPIVLVGATQLPKDHIYTQAQYKFAELVKEYYDGPLEVDMHHSGDLGGEKDFFEFMMQGVSVDYAIVAPSWIATWNKKAAFMDTPFLWADRDHWQKSIERGVFKAIERELLEDQGVRILGYAGGGVRNMILKDPIQDTSDLPDVLMRVMGSPIQARVFNATGIKATPMDYGEVYNAIKTGVVDGLENEASSLITMKFYEVAENIILTQHTITVRPFCFSEKRLQSFPKDLQAAVIKAGKEAADWARETESSKDWETLQQLEGEGKIELYEFDTTEMKERALPVVKAYAEELNVTDVYEQIESLR
jgi:TRAP-type transport system periplasmic protein